MSMACDANDRNYVVRRAVNTFDLTIEANAASYWFMLDELGCPDLGVAPCLLWIEHHYANTNVPGV